MYIPLYISIFYLQQKYYFLYKYNTFNTVSKNKINYKYITNNG